MTTTHPVERSVPALTNTDNVPKADYVAHEKARVRQRATVAEVVGDNFSGAFGLDIDGHPFDRDTTDTTTMHDGVETVVDSVGTRFKRVSTSLTRVGFLAHKNGTNQTGIAAGLNTKVTFGTKTFDTGGYYDTTTSRFAPPAGTYLLNVQVTFSAGLVDGQLFGFYIYRNGGFEAQFLETAYTTLTQKTCVGSKIVNVNSGDYFEVWCLGQGAGNKNLSGAFYATYFSAVKIDGMAGADGADGSDPGILLTWDVDTVDSNQGSGKLWANNASLASATVLYISKTGRGGSSLAAFLAALDDSTNASSKGTLVLTKPSDETQATFTAGTVTDATDYIKLAVSGHSGTTAFTAADPISFQFSRAGDAGGGLAALVDDTSPQLGGDLDFNGRTATGWTAIAPKISRYSAISGTFTPTAGATLIHARLIGAGGGGSGNNYSNFIPQSQYGERGGDTMLDLLAGKTATMTIATPAVVTSAGHGLVANQPFYFTTTGALPTGVAANTIYYVKVGTITADTFQFSTRPYNPFPGDDPPAVNTSGSQSGVHTVNAHRYVVQGGGGGGIIGDQGTPLSYIGLDSAGPSGHLQSWGVQGGAGGAIYGQRVGSGPGGVNPMGGNSSGALLDSGIAGTNGTGAGGGGAGATPNSSGGTGGASGSYGEVWLVPDPAGHKFVAGAGGAGGPAGAETVTVTIATPAVFSLTDHGMQGDEQIQFTTTGALPTGLTANTTYYVLPGGLTANTFRVSATLGGSPVATSGSQSGVHTMTSGYPGGDGGHGAIIFTEFFGLM